MKKFLQKLLWPLSGCMNAANIADGTHTGSISRLADAAASEYILVKKGSDDNHVAVCGVADVPIGVLASVPEAAEDGVTVKLLGAAPSTVLMIASEAIAAGVEVYTAASGKVQDATTSITYYKVGVSLTAAAANELIEVDPCPAIKVVVA
jgi:hypothetical protein